ncbi:hypothetical protein ASG63_22160 [Methylobacterium sp. Leaf94]|uniref:hypothetical protein n=1 Tax=Methylobacterium sp. Leaf94 TaxID=1736250 RepID=UPI0006FAE605|nr:hypothetical protein [Methylobacterium sp. Leaf94]KQU22559.1 hypothetical protein ASG63_22160 [Methylobacterium sp. Leaf94]
MAQALEIAARQPALQGPIALAKAVRFAAGDQGPLDATSIREEEKDAFYAALGKRLLMLSDLPADIRAEITSALFEQCLRLGPSGLDAGVFMVAIDQDFDRAPLAPEVRAYRRRLDNDSDLRISLALLLEAVIPSGATTEL